MSPWQELGIEPTGEVGAIRKAYAVRLKKSRPEDDPAGFVRLRAAYEAALALAPRLAPQGEPAKAQPAGADIRAPDAPPPLKPKLQLIPLESEAPGPSNGRPPDAERSEIRRRPADTSENETKPDRDQGPGKPRMRSTPIDTDKGEDAPDRPPDRALDVERPDGRPSDAERSEIRRRPADTSEDETKPDGDQAPGKPSMRSTPIDMEKGEDAPDRPPDRAPDVERPDGRPSEADRSEIRRRPADTAEDETEPDRDQEPGKPGMRSTPIDTETGDDTPDRPPDHGPDVERPTVRSRQADPPQDGETQDGGKESGKPIIRVMRVGAEDGEDGAPGGPAAGGQRTIRSRPLEPGETGAGEARPPPLDRAKPVVRAVPVDLQEDGGAKDQPRNSGPKIVPQQPRPTPVAAEPLLTPESEAAISSITEALDRRLSEEAANLLLVASSKHLLPLRMEFALKDKLAALLLADDKIPIARLVSFARQFGWYDESDILRSRGDTAQNRLCAKVATAVAAERERDRAAAAERDRLRKEAVEQARRQEALARRGSFKDLGRILLLFVFAVTLLSGILRTLGPLPPSGTAQQVSRPAQPVPSAQTSPSQTAFAPVPRATPAEECRSGFVSPNELSAQPLSELQRCAQRGASGAQNALGLRYLYGQGVAQDDSQAAVWFKAAAELGHTEARRNFAWMLRFGQGIAKDPAQARALYQRGAELGDATAQLSLADMLQDGEGGPVDPAGAYRWIRSAALAGDVPAMTRLGGLYASGLGTRRDLAKSAAWRLAAARAGDAPAMLDYGVMVFGGWGIPSDMREAYRWLSLAVKRGQPRPAEFARVVGALPNAERLAIDRELTSWQPAAPIAPSIDSR